MSNKNTITILAFGNSITAAAQQKLEDRWPEILRRVLQERFPKCIIKVINAGVGGNTSREGLRRLEQDVLMHDPHLVLVEFGNDGTPEPERHVSFEEFTANLDQIRTKVAERNNGRLIMLTFPPVVDQWVSIHSEHRESYKQNGGPDAYQAHYRKLTRQFAQAHGLPLADIDKALRAEMARHGPGEYILPDGVHLTAQGNRVVAEVVLEVLSAMVGKLPI